MILIIILNWLLTVILSIVLICVWKRVKMHDSCLIDFMNELRCFGRDFRIGCDSMDEFYIQTINKQIGFDARMDFLESQMAGL